MPQVAFRPTIPPWKTVHVTYLTASSLRAKRNNADHTCIWSCSLWVGRSSARCLPDSTCKSYQQRSVYRAACCSLFRGGCWLQGTPQRSVGQCSTSPCMWLILRHRSFNKAIKKYNHIDIKSFKRRNRPSWRLSLFSPVPPVDCCTSNIESRHGRFPLIQSSIIRSIFQGWPARRVSESTLSEGNFGKIGSLLKSNVR
jgi:hypothetical protein